METETQATTPAAAETSETHAAAALPTATAPATRQRPRTRRERGRPEFHPTTTVYHSTNPEAKLKDEIDEIVVDEDAVRLDYEFVLRGGREEVVRVKSQLILPMALALETLPQTESSFPEMIDRVLFQPLNTKLWAFLQRLFDAASRAAIAKETAAAAEPPFRRPVGTDSKPSKPTNGTPITMPELDCKPPLPTRPGSRDWEAGKNGV